MAQRIGAHLRRCGVTVVETRPDGKAVSLAQRCAIANGIQGLDLFVSLHSNAAGGSGWSSAKGWSAYLYGAGGAREQAAQAILTWVRQLSVTVRSTPIVYDPSLYVLKHTVAPAVLIEHAFHTSKEDVEDLKSDVWRDLVAVAEARGIADYLGIAWVPEVPQTPQEPAVDEELEKAVDVLAAAGIIDSPDRWKALDRGPDFVKLAEAYGLRGFRVRTREEMERTLDEALASGTGAVIDCMLDIDEMVRPMVAAGSPITDFLLD